MKAIENIELEATGMRGPMELSCRVEGLREVVRSKVSRVCLLLSFLISVVFFLTFASCVSVGHIFKRSFSLNFIIFH